MNESLAIREKRREMARLPKPPVIKFTKPITEFTYVYFLLHDYTSRELAFDGKGIQYLFDEHYLQKHT